jgi:drug/metabolite transporter (DMT)-like permease
MRRLFLLSFVWGWSFLFIKVAVEGMTPSTVAWARIALGATVLVGVLRRRGIPLPVERATLRHFVVVALSGSIVPFTMLSYAEQHISSALTSVLNASTPLFTAAFAALALSERLRRVQLAGLAVGVVGVAVAAGLGVDDLSGASLWATIAAALAGAGYGWGFVYIRRHLSEHPPVAAAAGQLAVAAVLAWPVALGTTLASGIDLTPRRVGAVVLLGVLGTGFAYVLSYGVVADLGPTAASLTTYLIPVVAVIVGIVVLDEAFEWRLVLGGGLTILGVAAVNRWRAPAPDPGSAAAPVPAAAD